MAIDAGLNYPARQVVETLEQLEQEIGLSQYIRCDNGPEFISKTFISWCQSKHIEIKYTQPGKPMQNGLTGFIGKIYWTHIILTTYIN